MTKDEIGKRLERKRRDLAAAEEAERRSGEGQVDVVGIGVAWVS